MEAGQAEVEEEKQDIMIEKKGLMELQRRRCVKVVSQVIKSTASYLLPVCLRSQISK
jgi:hypothetical protein